MVDSGMKEAELIIEYSKSNRATCKRCKEKIQKDQIRVGFLSQFDEHGTYSYKHLECFQVTKKYQDIEPTDIPGYYSLSEEDQIEVSEYFMGAGRKQKNTMIPKKNKKLTFLQEEEKEQHAESEFKAITKKKKSKKTEVVQPYSEQQQVEYFKHQTDLQKHTISQLKEMCRINNQKVTGKKGDLIDRIADGLVLGQIPPCPACSGGKLNFNIQTGEYKCPGYFEDENMVRCGKKFAFDQIERLDWINEQ